MRWLRVLLGIAGALALAAGVVWLILSNLPTEERPAVSAPVVAPADPRLAYRGPYQNVHPAVGYVGDAACVKCHRRESAGYHRHPMARTLEPIARSTPVEKYGPSAHNPFEAFGAQLVVDRQGKRVWHRERWLGPDGKPAAELDLEVGYAIGSGLRGRSYLVAREGFLFQSPISWFSQKKIWDKSPGFKEELRAGRAIGAECLFCHSNRVFPHEGSINRYETPLFPTGHGIGCERCHGPGERHVATGGAEFTIVNPLHLEPPLREAVCQQCHLEGAARVLRAGRQVFDFRPGMPLEEFWSVFVLPSGGADRKAVNHTEQMYQSLCFQRSPGEGKLGCITCHNPHRHVGPEERVGYYRKRCLDCHKKQHGCSLPLAARLRKSPQDSCIDCHMPPYGASDIPHTAATDHTIVRRPGAPPHGEGPGQPGKALLADFFHKQAAARGGVGARALGLALVDAAKAGVIRVPEASREAVALLERALQDFPGDAATWEGKAFALWMQQRGEEAIASFENALAKGPEREESLWGLVLLTDALGQDEAALGHCRRLIRLNPWQPAYRGHLAALLERKGNLDELARETGAWLRLDPGSVAGRKTLVGCLLRQGKRAEARAEFARLEARRPRDLPTLRAWFEQQRR